MIQQLTRPNALFLSTAAQANHLQLTTIYSHISAIAPPMHQYKSFVELPVKMLGVAVVDIMMAVKKRGPDWTPRAKELLAFADLGLVDFKVEDESLYLNHGTNETPRWLLFEEESNGTQHFFVQLFGVLSRLHFGTLLVVDEIENNLHPTLVARIIKMFQNKETNPNRAQLLFTTHNTHLLSHKEEGEPLIRRDQIWLTEKDNQGATTLYPLTDYSARKNENLEKGYLQGRYGGVPYLVDFVLNEAS